MKALLTSLLLLSLGLPSLAQTAPPATEPVPINLSPAATPPSVGPANLSPAATPPSVGPANLSPTATPPSVGPLPTSTAAESRQPGLGQLTAGLTLTLRYPGPGVTFAAGLPWQEILVVEQNVTDSKEQVVIPAGTQVIGRFETEGRSSRFVAQALIQPTQNLRISGQSSLMENRLGPNALVSMKLLSDWRPMTNSGF